MGFQSALISLVMASGIVAHPIAILKPEEILPKPDMTIYAESIGIDHVSPHEDALPNSNADLLSFNLRINSRNDGRKNFFLSWPYETGRLYRLWQWKLEVWPQREWQNIGCATKSDIVRWGVPQVYDVNPRLELYLGFRILRNELPENYGNICPALKFSDLLLPIYHLSLNFETFAQPLNVSGHCCGNTFHSCRRPCRLSNGAFHVTGLSIGYLVHFLDRLPQALGLASENKGLDETDGGDYAGETDHPPVGGRLAMLLTLFCGGFLLSLCGWENLDHNRRLIRAALVGGGLFLQVLGVVVWLGP